LHIFIKSHAWDWEHFRLAVVALRKFKYLMFCKNSAASPILLLFKSGDTKQEFDCKPLPKLSLHVTPYFITSLIQEGCSSVTLVTYQKYWWKHMTWHILFFEHLYCLYVLCKLQQFLYVWSELMIYSVPLSF